MSVWFVFRNPSIFPAGKSVQTFPDASLLEWFQNNWRQSGSLSELKANTQRLLGFEVDGFAEFQHTLNRDDIPAPTSIGELRRAIDFDWPEAGQIRVEEHGVQIRVDREKDQRAIYLFDHHFLNEHPERVGWLIHQPWQLPTEFGTGFETGVRTRPVSIPGRWEGTLFGVLFSGSAHWLEEPVPAFRLQGVRLPQLSRYLLETNLAEHACSAWEQHLSTLGQMIRDFDEPRDPVERSFHQSILDKPGEDFNWQIYGDWLEENNQSRAEYFILEKGFQFLDSHSVNSVSGHIGSKSQPCHCWQIDKHVAQITLRLSSQGFPQDGLHETWILFDDLWVGANSNMATNLLALTTRWDVLTDPDLPAGTLYA